MFEKENNGKIEQREIDFFNHGIGIDSEHRAKEINPNEKYWVQVFGSRPILTYRSPENADFFEKYWVPIDLFNMTEAMCIVILPKNWTVG